MILTAVLCNWTVVVVGVPIGIAVFANLTLLPLETHGGAERSREVKSYSPLPLPLPLPLASP